MGPTQQTNASRVVRLAVLIIMTVSGMLFCGKQAGAQTIIYDNLNSVVGGFRVVTPTTWEAQRFNSDAMNLVLQNATLRLLSGNGGTGTFFLRLYADDAGRPASTPIATLFTGPNPFTGSFPQDGNIMFDNLNQSLDPNTNYWLVLGQDAGATFNLRWGITTDPTSPPGTGSGYQSLNANTPNSGTNWILASSNPRTLRLNATVAIESPFEIESYAIAGGGGFSTAGAFELSGTIGQHDAGTPMTGGAFELTGGFWAGISNNPIILGDVNHDGVVSLLDVAPFVALLTSGTFIPEADINNDGFVNLLDVAPFVDLLTGG